MHCIHYMVAMRIQNCTVTISTQHIQARCRRNMDSREWMLTTEHPTNTPPHSKIADSRNGKSLCRPYAEVYLYALCDSEWSGIVAGMEDLIRACAPLANSVGTRNGVYSGFSWIMYTAFSGIQSMVCDHGGRKGLRESHIYPCMGNRCFVSYITSRIPCFW